MGGTWTDGVDKERVGLYINFKRKANDILSSAELGKVAIPLVLNWGPAKKFILITEEYEYLLKLGYKSNHESVRLIREARKGSKNIAVYRLNEGTKATIQLKAAGADPLLEPAQTVTAVYGGTRGNDIIIKIANDILEPTKYVVTTIVDTDEVDEQIVINFSELVDNDWVVFDGAGTPALTAGAALAGGSNGEAPLVKDYTDYFAVAETESLHTMALITNEESLKETFIEYVKRMRNEGKKFQGVIANSPSDYEGIISVRNGVILDDGTKLDANKAVAWVAGVSAGAGANKSNTYKVYEGAVDAYPRLKPREIIDSMKQGQIVFDYDGKSVKIERDINTLISYGDNSLSVENKEKSKVFTTNRTIRVLDKVNNDMQEVFVEDFIGKIDNNGDGHAILSAAANGYLIGLQDAKILQNVDPENDFVIDSAKSVDDSVYARVGVQVINSVEKLYFNVEVR